MNTEQERAEFEARAIKERIAYRDEKLGVCFYNGERNSYWIGYQAGQAALQSQDREYAERLDWIEANHGCDITEFADGTWEVDVPDGPYGVGKGMREAIDHARRVEGDWE